MRRIRTTIATLGMALMLAGSLASGVTSKAAEATDEATIETTDEVTEEADEDADSADDADDDTDEFTRTAQEIAEDMGYGINLGNTMECSGTKKTTVTGYETAWGAPVTTEAMITGMKNAGFDSIRIPVSWGNLMSDDGNYTISSEYFDRVDMIVGWALDNDMYVIINDHYDSNWWTAFASDDTYDESMKHYTTMWTQIAEHYRDYSEKLILESANEELTSTIGYTKINAINQAFVDTVRATGGNNAKRYLLIAGMETDIDKTVNSKFVMPEDTIDSHLMVSVHYYSPWNYCGMWADESWGKADYDWGTTADKTTMENALKKLTKFTDEGYAVVIGEYSVLPDYVKKGVYNRKDNDAEFMEYFLSLCKEYGYATYLWNTEDWYDKTTCTMRYGDIAALYKLAVKAAEASDTGIKVSWGAVDAAAKYKLYRNDSTTAIATLTGTSYTDKNLVSGTTYTYTIEAYDSDGNLIDEDKAGQSATYKDAPTVQTPSNASTGVSVTWNKVELANNYKLYRNGKLLATLTGTSYTDKNVTSGTKYTYTVEAIRGTDTSYVISKDTTGKSITYLKQPTLGALSNTSTGITVKWGKVTGATGYTIYKKTGTSTTWKAIKTISGGSVTSYTDTSCVAGTSYSYTVKAMGSSSSSSYNATGKKLKRLANMKLSTVTNTATGVSLTWKKAAGAAGYYVYRKTDSGSYTLIKKLTSASTLKYTDTKAVNGTSYVYKIVAYSGTNVSTATGTRIVRLATPKISSLKNTASKKLTVKWNVNKKATGYQIKYVKGTTTKTLTVKGASASSKVLSALTKGSTYKVYVRSYKVVSGKTYYSGWSTVKSCKVSK